MMPMACDVSVILVNYNGKLYIDTLFDALSQLEHGDFSYEIVFVDNASKDDSVEYLRQRFASRFDNLVIVESLQNLGFAGGNNLGVSKAKGRYIVLLNNDTKPERDWLDQLYHYIDSRPDVVIANSKLVFFYDFIKVTFFTQDKIVLKREIRVNGKPYNIENKFCKNTLCEPNQLVCFGHSEIWVPLLDNNEAHIFEFDPIQCTNTDLMIIGERRMPMEAGVGMRVTLSREETSVERITLIQNAGSGINENLDGYDIGFCQEDGEVFSREYEVDSGCGAAIIFRKADFELCHGFDERFFMYYEDTDLSCRMKRNGGKIMYYPKAIVRHIHAGSSGEWSPFFIYHVCKNKLLFVAKNFGLMRFLRYFKSQMYSGIREKNRSKLQGTWAALRIVVSDSLRGRLG